MSSGPPATIHSPISPPRPLRQDAIRNRKLLLDAARRVFANEGLDSGVETVARKAGVGTGTLYRHFPSKDDLILALVDELSQEVLDNARSFLARRDGSGLWDFLHATGVIQSRNQGLLCRLWVDGPRPAQQTAIRETIAELVDDAHDHATLPPGRPAARHHSDPARPARRHRSERRRPFAGLEALSGNGD